MSIKSSAASLAAESSTRGTDLQYRKRVGRCGAFKNTKVLFSFMKKPVVIVIVFRDIILPLDVLLRKHVNLLAIVNLNRRSIKGYVFYLLYGLNSLSKRRQVGSYTWNKICYITDSLHDGAVSQYWYKNIFADKF